MSAFTLGEWYVLIQHELFLFAAFFFILGAIDEFAVDLVYAWLAFKRRIVTRRIDEAKLARRSLAGTAAVFVPAWQEAKVIGPMLAHASSVWTDPNIRFYVGCYRNDRETQAAVAAAAARDPRIQRVVHDRDGPTSKACCLNALYAALVADEAEWGRRARMVVLQDAEDMVDPLGLVALDQAIDTAEFVQLPVVALPQRHSRLIAGHYLDEFAESHGKVMVVRDALRAGIPGAGVGCAVERETLTRLADRAGEEGPFAVQSLTEDYELGLNVGSIGGRDRFLRLRTLDGRLIATRSYFPARVGPAVRQKTRWVHGIALQGWDRLGWNGGLVRLWMKLRDRRGPFAALLLALAYLLLLLTALGWMGQAAGLVPQVSPSPLLRSMLAICLIAVVWRIAIRMGFTAREFGWREGLLAAPRSIVSNIIAIIAGRRALIAYLRMLAGEEMRWDKTDHDHHPTTGPAPMVRP